MRSCTFVLLATFATFGAAAESTSAICERIQNLDGLISERRATITRLQTRFTEQHPDVVFVRRSLASLEAAREADVSQAKEQGITCPSSDVAEEADAQSRDQQEPPQR